ncbi:unnamed protein product [Rotaria socialis]|uniref:Uncharacterized protein n=2 Tax=Rotaria socialis TaxID=392032 RepID=A0A817SKF8_9BILA|nr:unnamed protein product [Rotaria socialis]
MIPLHVLTSDNYEQQWEFETLLHGFREVLQRFARQQEKANDISDEAIHLLKNKSEFLHLQCFLQTVNVILYFLSVFGKGSTIPNTSTLQTPHFNDAAEIINEQLLME